MFTWAKSSTSTVIFVYYSWNNHFVNTVVTSLRKFASDHTLLILCSNFQNLKTTHILRFEKSWLARPGLWTY
jgi:S-adenosylmethionine:tRNA-ribosyltransferase-isomerase (queuine synthetase)